MKGNMLFTGLPLCSDKHQHVLVVEESPISIILEIHDKNKIYQADAKYFLPLHENHPLVVAIFNNENRLFVDKVDLRKKFGVNLSDFRTVSAH